VENSGYIALSRMIAQQNALDVRATNIANINTPGFKAQTVLFSDYLLNQNGASTAPGDKTIQLVQDRATYRDWSQGDLTKTGNPLDLALQGDGFFAVDTPRGERYTRAGRFTLSASNQIVDMNGDPVVDTNGNPITVPAGSTGLTITSNGTVTTSNGAAGQLRIVQFADNQSLQAEGNTLFNTTQTPAQMAQPNVVQGAVEGANTEAVVQLTRLMDEMQQFNFASQFTDGEDQRRQQAIDKIGRKGVG
jgi:flagellar basal-body rod protein FlgF